MATDKWTEISGRDRGVADKGDTAGAFGTLADPGGDLVVSEIQRSVACGIAFHVNAAETSAGQTHLIELLPVDLERQTYVVTDFYVIEVTAAVAGDTARLQRKPSGSAVNITDAVGIDGTDGSISRAGAATGNDFLREEITPSDILQLEVVLADSSNHNVEIYGFVSLMPIKGLGVL